MEGQTSGPDELVLHGGGSESKVALCRTRLRPATQTLTTCRGSPLAWLRCCKGSLMTGGSSAARHPSTSRLGTRSRRRRRRPSVSRSKTHSRDSAMKAPKPHRNGWSRQSSCSDEPLIMRASSPQSRGAEHVVVSLCSGVGGLEIGAGHMPTVVSESNQDCAAILAKRFPDAVNIGDWTQIDCVGDLPCSEPALITAGLPCQPVSSSGSRRGDKDERWLFDNLAQMLLRSDERPLILLENVPALLSHPFRGMLRRWHFLMGQMGYRIVQTMVAACEVGAPHRRQRWFAIAVHSDSADVHSIFPRGSGERSAMVSSARLLPTPTAADAKRGAERFGIRSAQKSLANALLPPTAHISPEPISFLGGPSNGSTASIAGRDGRVDRYGWRQYQTAVDAWSDLLGRCPPGQVQATNGRRLLQLVSPDLT